MTEIPIIPAEDVPNRMKRIFLSIIKDIDNNDINVEQKIAIFDILIEGFKIVLYLMDEFEKVETTEEEIDDVLSEEELSEYETSDLEISEILDIVKRYKMESYLFGLNSTMLKYDKLFEYSDYDKTRDSKLIDISIKSARLTLDIFAEFEFEWGNPWNWKNDYIKHVKSYFIGIKDGLEKFKEITDYMIDYLYTHAMFCPDCGKIKYKDYFDIFCYGINTILNNFPLESEKIAEVINDIDLMKKSEYISKEYLWKDIKDYIAKKIF